MKVRISLPLLIATLLASVSCYHGSKPSDIGRQAPDFALKDSGRTISLAQFRGKVVVLNFWASWCPPCVEELPSLMQMQNDLRDKGVIVLGVSVDSDPGDYEKFLKDHAVNFITIRDPGQQSDKGVDAPTSSLYGTYKF